MGGGVLFSCHTGEADGKWDVFAHFSLILPLEKWGLQDCGGLNVNCDSTSTLFLVFLLWLFNWMCFGGDGRWLGECIWDE